MRRHQLVRGLREHKVADLRTRVNAVDWLQGVRVPKSDAAVRSAAAGREQARLIGIPGDGLDCCLMLRELGDRLIAVPVPYHESVVVATTGKLLPVIRPLQPTHLLFMARIVMGYAVLHPQVAAEHHLVLGAGAQSRAVPGDGAYTLMMLAQAADLLSVVDVPYLGLALISTYGQVIAFVAPANTGDLVVTENFAELLHLRGAGAPHVHGLVESDCKDVRGAPVDQVQVEVILELWCIQHFVRHLVDPARFAEVSLATRVT